MKIEIEWKLLAKAVGIFAILVAVVVMIALLVKYAPGACLRRRHPSRRGDLLLAADAGGLTMKNNPIFDECVSRVDPEVREEVRRNIDFEQELYNRFGQIKDFTLGMRIGQYFYELGCRRTAEKYDEIEYNRQREESVPNGLEEAAEKHASSVEGDYAFSEGPDHYCSGDLEEAFIAGAAWQKEQDEKEQADLFTIVALDAAERAKKKMIEDFPKWRKIKAGERLPCPAYVWTTAYDNYPDCFEGRLMPNIQGVKVGRDTWYLPVDVIHNLPKED